MCIKALLLTAQRKLCWPSELHRRVILLREEGVSNLERTIPPTASWTPAGTHLSLQPPGKCGPASGLWISFLLLQENKLFSPLPAPSSAFHVV